MLKQKLTYTDYEGTERTEDFYFNLTKAEVFEMEMQTVGGLQKLVEKIIEAMDTKSLIALFKDLILRSYGEKSPDGKRFIKSKELADAFSQTEAYSDLFYKLATDTDAATTFVNGIIPKAEPQDHAKPSEKGQNSVV